MGRKSLRRTVIGVLLVLVGLGAFSGAALATPPTGNISTTLGRATLPPFHLRDANFKIKSKTTTDVVTIEQRFAPGGTTGWHSHPGPAFILVAQGTITLYDGDDPTCTPHRYSAGEGFVDAGFGHVHIARNEGTTDVVVYATYLNVPVGGSPRIDKPAPGNCPF